MRTLKLTIAYDGNFFHGFQKQIGQNTVQAELEQAFKKLFGEDITIIASGRTDAKVHAKGQVISFKTSGSIPTENIVNAAKTILPSSIAVIDAKEMHEDFHARFDAKKKEYIYIIDEYKKVDPFSVNFAWLLGETLDKNLLDSYSNIIIGEHDFSSFQASGSKVKTSIREIYKADWVYKNEKLVFSILGNGFLYHMVRNLVGTMVECSQKKLSSEHFNKILLAKDRRIAGKTSPPQGLYLNKVFY